MSASIHQRLLNIARNTERPFNEVLQYFTMERFLHRLSLSPSAESFVLKGALLFRVWNVPDSRATSDIDFLAYVDNSPESLAAVFREVGTIDSPDDDLVFDPDTVKSRRIKEDADYAGVRTRLRGQLGNGQVVMQIDVGFGDLIHPRVVQADYPALLDLPAPSLRMYPPETVIAEKAEAMVYLGSLNSRMKDFYDLWKLSQQFDFEGNVLCEALNGTFRNRNTEVIEFDNLVADLLNAQGFDKQWVAFLQNPHSRAQENFPRPSPRSVHFCRPCFRPSRAMNSLTRNGRRPARGAHSSA